MRRSVILPELADVLDLPAADRTRGLFAWSYRRQILRQSPTADGGAVDGKVVAAEDFGSGKAVGAARMGGEELAQGGQHRGWKRLATIAAGKSGPPVLGTALRRRGEIGTIEFVEAGATEPEFGAGIGTGEFLSAEAAEQIPDERSGMTSVELAGVFIPGT